MYEGGEGGGEGEESATEDLTGFLISSELLALWIMIRVHYIESQKTQYY